jgi:hypothetical protein
LGKLSFDQDEHLIFALQNGWVENNVGDLLSREFDDEKRPSASANAAEIMRTQIAKSAGDATRQQRWLVALAGIARPSDVPFIFERASSDARVLGALRAERPESAEKLLTPLFDSAHPELRAQGVRLAGMWKVAAFVPQLRTLAFEQSMPQAFTALLGLSPDEVAQHVLGRLQEMKTPQDAKPILSALFSQKEGRVALENALKKPNALAPDAAKLTLQALNVIGLSDGRISPLLMNLAGINSALPAYTSTAPPPSATLRKVRKSMNKPVAWPATPPGPRRARSAQTSAAFRAVSPST